MEKDADAGGNVGEGDVSNMEQIEIPDRPSVTVFRISRDELRSDFYPFNPTVYEGMIRKSDDKRFLRWDGDGCTTFSWNRFFLFVEGATKGAVP